MRPSKRLRKVAGLTVALLALGTLVVTPTTAAQSLTKKKGDKRFLGNTTVVTSTTTVPAATGASLTAQCPPGMQATGGGGDSPLFLTSASPGQFMFTLESKAVFSGGRAVAWNVETFNQSPNPVPITAHAVCAK
jgi:hypothetical protein